MQLDAFNFRRQSLDLRSQLFRDGLDDGSQAGIMTVHRISSVFQEFFCFGKYHLWTWEEYWRKICILFDIKSTGYVAVLTAVSVSPIQSGKQGIFSLLDPKINKTYRHWYLLIFLSDVCWSHRVASLHPAHCPAKVRQTWPASWRPFVSGFLPSVDWHNVAP